MATEYFDALEIRDPEVREHELFAALPEHLKHAVSKSTFFSRQLADIDLDSINTRDALVSLPLLRKSELSDLQQSAPPFGGLAAFAPDALMRIFASPGPIYEPQTRRADGWRLSRALFAAGIRKGMLVHNTFSYHFSPAGMMLESAITQLGCVVFPAGVGQTELQVQAIATLRPQAYTGTPSFLKIILDAGTKSGADLASLNRGVVSGEALPPTLRSEISDYGVDLKQAYATADIGLIAYESEAMEGLIIDEGVIVEIVRLGTGDPVDEGEVGEIVVTVFNPDYPLIRFATGDLSMVMPGPSPCGRTNMRIKGWMGRADQTTKVRGMFVQPAQIAEVVKRFTEVSQARLIVSSENHQDQMLLECEATDHSEELRQSIVKSVREICKLRAEVKLRAPDSLPRDGVVIQDARTYD